MAKRTLLDMVQSIMSDMDSDIVTSITDTVEAGQVASIIRDVFEQMIADQVIPELNTVGKLSTISLISHPGAINYLTIPDNYTEVWDLQYDIQAVGATSPDFTSIKYITPPEFIKIVQRNQADDGNVVHVTDPGTDGIQYYIRNNVAPRLYTSFDDHNLAFDAIQILVDTVQMTGIKSIVQAKTVPVWTVDDTFVPQIDENLFPYLLAEAKSTCFVALKQQANPKVDKQARQQAVRIQDHKFRDKSAEKRFTRNTGPNYGRS